MGVSRRREFDLVTVDWCLRRDVKFQLIPQKNMSQGLMSGMVTVLTHTIMVYLQVARSVDHKTSHHVKTNFAALCGDGC